MLNLLLFECATNEATEQRMDSTSIIVEIEAAETNTCTRMIRRPVGNVVFKVNLLLQLDSTTT